MKRKTDTRRKEVNSKSHPGRRRETMIHGAELICSAPFFISAKGNEMVNLLTKPFILAGIALLLSFGLLPDSQKTDIQASVFTGAVITTTTQSEVIACGQPAGSIGRKTLVVENGADSDGAITVTVELREDIDGSDFTSGYMANNGVTTGTITYTAKTPSDDIAARFCNVSATSESTSTITVTLRKE